MSEQYEKWRNALESTFPWIADVVETCLSVAVLLWFDNVRLPFALVLVGRPAGWKTTALKCIDDKRLDFVYYTDDFTPKAFVSHSAKKSKKELAKIDLLPRIKEKVFIVPELAPIFTQIKEALMQSIGRLTRILDGQGYISDSGAQGQRGYQGRFKFMWLAATTPMPYRVWEVMATLGTKMYFLHVPDTNWTREQRVQWFLEDEYHTRVEKAQKATAEFLLYLKEQTPIVWNKKQDPKGIIFFIQDLGLMLARLRGRVNVATRTTYDEMSGQQRVTVHTTPIIEDPTRAFIMLHTLATGHAFVQGRRQLSEDDIPYLIEVALSSAPKDRVEAFKLLLKSGGVLKASDIMEATRCSRHTALRAMETLSILQLAEDVDRTQSRTEGFSITIRKDMRWCLENKYMQKWGAKAPVERPMKHRTREELEPVGIFGN